MGFIDSYKHLEKLCGEVLNDDRRISAYIDEMLNQPHGSYFVKGWDNDLKQLKHYRWVRNQISHEPNCSEQNMCEPGDTLWLDGFYSRIMNQNDPLALYYQATKPQTAYQSDKAQPFKKTSDTLKNSTYNQSDTNHKKSSRKSIGCVILVVCSVLIAAAIFLLYEMLEGGCL